MPLKERPDPFPSSYRAVLEYYRDDVVSNA